MNVQFFSGWLELRLSWINSWLNEDISLGKKYGLYTHDHLTIFISVSFESRRLLVLDSNNITKLILRYQKKVFITPLISFSWRLRYCTSNCTAVLFCFKLSTWCNHAGKKQRLILFKPRKKLKQKKIIIQWCWVFFPCVEVCDGYIFRYTFLTLR